MIATCEICSAERVPCSGCEESQRCVCYVCQGDIADPYCELETPPRPSLIVPALVGAAFGLAAFWVAVCACLEVAGPL